MQIGAFICHAAHKLFVAGGFVDNIAEVPRRNFFVGFAHSPRITADKRTDIIRYTEKEQRQNFACHLRRFGKCPHHLRNDFYKFVLVYLVRHKSVVGMQNFRQKRFCFDFRHYLVVRFVVRKIAVHEKLFDIRDKTVVVACLDALARFSVADMPYVVDVICLLRNVAEHFPALFATIGVIVFLDKTLKFLQVAFVLVVHGNHGGRDVGLSVEQSFEGNKIVDFAHCLEQSKIVAVCRLHCLECILFNIPEGKRFFFGIRIAEQLFGRKLCAAKAVDNFSTDFAAIVVLYRKQLFNVLYCVLKFAFTAQKHILCFVGFFDVEMRRILGKSVFAYRVQCIKQFVHVAHFTDVTVVQKVSAVLDYVVKRKVVQPDVVDR